MNNELETLDRLVKRNPITSLILIMLLGIGSINTCSAGIGNRRIYDRIEYLEYRAFDHPNLMRVRHGHEGLGIYSVNRRDELEKKLYDINCDLKNEENETICEIKPYIEQSAPKK